MRLYPTNSTQARIRPFSNDHIDQPLPRGCRLCRHESHCLDKIVGYYFDGFPDRPRYICRHDNIHLVGSKHDSVMFHSLNSHAQEEQYQKK